MLMREYEIPYRLCWSYPMDTIPFSCYLIVANCSHVHILQVQLCPVRGKKSILQPKLQQNIVDNGHKLWIFSWCTCDFLRSCTSIFVDFWFMYINSMQLYQKICEFVTYYSEQNSRFGVYERCKSFKSRYLYFSFHHHPQCFIRNNYQSSFLVHTPKK